MTTERIMLSSGSTATLQVGVCFPDRQEQRDHTGDQLTITDHLGIRDREYFVTPDRKVFLIGRAIEIKTLPSTTAHYAESFGRLDEQDPETTKNILAIYDLFHR